MVKIKRQTGTDMAKADYEALASLRYTLRQFLRFSEEAAAAQGLSAQQHQALLAIKGFPGREHVSVGELAERLQVRHHSAVELVDRLSSDNLVVRESADDDRRKVHVSLTTRGLRLLSRLSAAHRQELRRIGPSFRRLLDKITME